LISKPDLTFKTPRELRSLDAKQYQNSIPREVQIDQMADFITDDGLTVNIRPARIEDAPSLQRNCLPADTVDQVKGFLERDAKEAEKGKKARIVADVGGEVVGNLEIEFSPHPLMPHVADVNTVVVNPKYQGKGIATAMFQEAFRIAKEKQIQIVRIDVETRNAPAHRLYLKVGFAEYGRLGRGIVRKGEYDDLIFLKKEL